MDTNNIDLADIDFYMLTIMDNMIGVYNKRFLMIYQGTSIFICKYDPDLTSNLFRNNFIPIQSIYTYEVKYKHIFDFFFSKFDSNLKYITETNLV